MASRKKVIIMGAAGRDFHNFNVYFRNKPEYEVVCFTAAQIPGIANRTYPPELSGKLYPRGIKIYPEEKLQEHVKKYKPDLVVLSYSDLPYMHVMHKASEVLSLGPAFCLLGTETMLKSRKPVIAVTAVRTGCGKSPATRRLVSILKELGANPVVVRHPMPYGNLKEQICQRFETVDDLVKNKCTIEEMEDYLPHIEAGTVVFSGVDYEKILREAEKEADIIIWDGGNNDFPFFKPDLWVVILDPLRPGHEITYYPGEVNLRMANIAIINKEKSANKEDIEIVRANARKYNPKAVILDADSEIRAKRHAAIKGKKVLVIEDGPTLTHGGMKFGAGFIAAKKHHCKIIDPRKYAAGSLKDVYKKYPQLGSVLPAVGYSQGQIKELEQTINRTPCDAVICATPVDLRKFIKVSKPMVIVTYRLKEIGKKHLEKILARFVKEKRIV